jgi:hypothetical protein
MNYSTIIYILLIIICIYAMTVVSSSIVKTILIFVLLWLLAKFLYNTYFSTGQYLTTGVSDATIQQIISSSDLAVNSTNSQPTNFTYSVWIYIDDWNYKYGFEKTIILRDASTAAVATTTTTPVVINPSTIIPSPFIYLGADSNKLVIQQAVYPSSGSSSIPTTNDVDKVEIDNIPLQKWVNVLVSVYGRTLDTYLDGKLVNTHILTNTAYVGNSTSNIYVTPSGGFSGFRSNLQYFPNETDPQTAWNIYANGYGTDGSLNNPYSVEVSLYNNGTQQGNYTF